MQEGDNRVENKRITTNLTRRGSASEAAFDIEFWQAAGEQARWDAMEEMVRDYIAMTGGDPDDIRLDRSVTCLRKRER